MCVLVAERYSSNLSTVTASAMVMEKISGRGLAGASGEWLPLNRSGDGDGVDVEVLGDLEGDLVDLDMVRLSQGSIIR